jgi:hypothetical protein
MSWRNGPKADVVTARGSVADVLTQFAASMTVRT